jgi:hypothetical protein
MNGNYDEYNRHLSSAVNELIETLFNSNYLRITKNDNNETLYEITGEIHPRNIRNITDKEEFTNKFNFLEQLMLIYYHLYQLENDNDIIAVNESVVSMLNELKSNPKFGPLEDIFGLGKYESTLIKWSNAASPLKPNRVLLSKDELNEEIKEILKLMNYILNHFIHLSKMVINNRILKLNSLEEGNGHVNSLKLRMETSNIGGNTSLKIKFENFLFSREILFLQDPIEIAAIKSQLDDEEIWILVSFNIIKEKFHNLDSDVNHFNLYTHWKNLSTYHLLNPNSHVLEKNIENVKDMLLILKSVLDLIQNLIELDHERIEIEKGIDKSKMDLKKFYSKILTFDKKNVYSLMSLSRILYEEGEVSEAKKQFENAFLSREIDLNCFAVASIPIVIDYIEKNNTMSHILIENFVKFYEGISVDTKSLVFSILQKIKVRNLDLILLKKLDKFEEKESDQILSRFGDYTKDFSENNNIFLATQCMKNLCEKTNSEDKWITREQLIDGITSVNPEIIIPIVIVNFKKSLFIITDKEKIALTELGRSQCGKQIRLEKSI